MTSITRRLKAQHNKYVAKLSCLEPDFGTILTNDKESFVVDFIGRFYGDCLRASIDEQLLPPKDIIEILVSFLVPDSKIAKSKVDETKTDIHEFKNSAFRPYTSKNIGSYKHNLDKLEEKLLKLRSFCEFTDDLVKIIYSKLDYYMHIYNNKNNNINTKRESKYFGTNKYVVCVFCQNKDSKGNVNKEISEYALRKYPCSKCSDYYHIRCARQAILNFFQSENPANVDIKQVFYQCQCLPNYKFCLITFCFLLH